MASIFVSLVFCIEGFTPDETIELHHLIKSNGGDVCDMLIDSTTHLVANEKRAEGFKERRVIQDVSRSSNQIWLVTADFVHLSVKAQFTLPEYQFMVKRIDRSKLLPELEVFEDTIKIETTTRLEEDIPELKSKLEEQGAQVWGFESRKPARIFIQDPIQQNDDEVELDVRYLLGPTNPVTNRNKVESKHINSDSKTKPTVKHTVVKHKKTRMPKKKLKDCRDEALKKMMPSKKLNESLDSEFSDESDENQARSDEELFISAGSTQQNTYLVSQDGKIWSLSINKYPVLMKIQPTASVCMVACGKLHTLALTVKGEVYSWGSSHAGQLGHGDFLNRLQATKIVTNIGNIPIFSISAAGNCSGALTNLGGCYMWGKNSEGQLGLGHTRSSASPSLILLPNYKELGQINSLQCGATHAMATTDNGFTLSWGGNRFGQLGRRTTQLYSALPDVIPNLRDVIQVSCGIFHSVAVSQSGEVLSWGNSKHYALGHTDVSSLLFEPTVISWFQEQGIVITQASAGATSTICLSSEGEVYGFGEFIRCRQVFQTVKTPIKLKNIRDVVEVRCNLRNFTLSIRNFDALLLRHAIEGNLESLHNIIQHLQNESERPETFSKYLQNLQTNEGNSLLHLACQYQQLEVVEYLLFRHPEISVNSVNQNGETCAHICAILGLPKILRALLNSPDIDINLVELNEQSTPLHLAIKANHPSVVRLLVLANADKTILNGEGMTALHLSVTLKRITLSHFLVRHGASIVDKDSNKLTALEWCEDWNERALLKEVAEHNEVFISYAHVDHTFAANLRAELNNHCLRCWMDDWRLEAGGEWRTAIGNGIYDAAIIIFIASSISVISDWCSKELYLAQEMGKKVIVILKNNVQEQMPYVDLPVRSLIQFGKDRNIFSFEGITKGHTKFRPLVSSVAGRVHGLLLHLSYATNLIRKNTSTKQIPKITDKNISELMQNKTLYVCFGCSQDDESFIQWIQYQLTSYNISFVDPLQLASCDSARQKTLVCNSWVYVLVVSKEVFNNKMVRQHLEWIEQSNSNSHLILLYHDVDYVKWIPADMFSKEKLLKLASLFSFYVSDTPWIAQLLHTLNLLRKQTQLDQHIQMLTERVAKQKQQLAQELPSTTNIAPKQNTLSAKVVATPVCS